MPESPGSPSAANPVDAELTVLAREHAPRVLARLAGRLGNVDLADDAVQEALIEAANRWPADGVPKNSVAWLTQVAKRKAIDRLRRADAERRRVQGAAAELASDPNETAVALAEFVDDEAGDDGGLADDRLRLIFLCCHPALKTEAQVALTLRLVGGLSTEEIAAAFLVPTPTLAQRISRAKTKIRDARIPLAMPDQLSERVDAVLEVLYLIFNEGYLTRADHGSPMRVDLCEEAIRLTVALCSLLDDHAEVHGLLALQLFHHARQSTRFDADADLVLLADQDRSQWDREAIGHGNTQLHRAMQLRRPGRFQLQAVIASHHANAATAADTNWSAIAGLYEHLRAADPSPVVAMNHAVAVGMAESADAGLAMLADIEGLDDYHLFHSVLAELQLRSGDSAGAARAFQRALDLAANPAEKRHLQQRLAELG